MVALPHNVNVTACVHVHTHTTVETALRAQCRYRKIAGDVCEGGEEGLFERFKAPCCGNNTLPPFFPTRPPEAIADTVHGDDNLDKLVAALAATGSLLGVAGLVAFVFLVLFILAVV